MIFSRLQLPQTLAALVFKIIQGKAKKIKEEEEKALFVHRNLLRATQTAKGRKKEKKSKIPRLLCSDQRQRMKIWRSFS